MPTGSFIILIEIDFQLVHVFGVIIFICRCNKVACCRHGIILLWFAQVVTVINKTEAVISQFYCYIQFICWQTKRTASWLSEKMTKDGHAVALLSGELSVEQRASVIGRFRRGIEKVLITTNVSARGMCDWTSPYLLVFIKKHIIKTVAAVIFQWVRWEGVNTLSIALYAHPFHC